MTTEPTQQPHVSFRNAEELITFLSRRDVCEYIIRVYKDEVSVLLNRLDGINKIFVDNNILFSDTDLCLEKVRRIYDVVCVLFETTNTSREKFHDVSPSNKEMLFAAFSCLEKISYCFGLLFDCYTRSFQKKLVHRLVQQSQDSLRLIYESVIKTLSVLESVGIKYNETLCIQDVLGDVYINARRYDILDYLVTFGNEEYDIEKKRLIFFVQKYGAHNGYVASIKREHWVRLLEIIEDYLSFDLNARHNLEYDLSELWSRDFTDINDYENFHLLKMRKGFAKTLSPGYLFGPNTGVTKNMRYSVYNEVDISNLKLFLSIVLTCNTIHLAINSFSEEEKPVGGDGESEVVSVLQTEEAMKLWKVARKRGWVDDKLQPKISQKKATVLALVIGELLDIKALWKPFEVMWNYKDMSTTHSQAKNTNYYADLVKEMRSALKNA